VPPLSGLNDRAMAQRKARPFGTQVEQLRTPAPMLRIVPPLDNLINTLELVVHHEDLRRGQPDWQPRTLPPADLDLLWSQLGRGAVFFGRRVPVPLAVRRADTGATAVVRKGADPVTITGDVVELILFLFGRSATNGLEFDGADSAVAAVRAADLGV
jgi:uncharacterized protein (TIGR03085 family)